MKPTIKILVLFLSVAGLFVAPGCKKFLQKDPQGTMTQESFPVSASDALLATNAVYTTTREWYYHSGGYPILDIMSDDARKGSNPSDQLSTVGPYDNFKITTTQDGLDRWWNEMYVGIKRANVVIEKVPLISMDTAIQTRYLAEAHFLRGLFYFDMVRAWGGVPIVTTTNPPLKLGRATEQETFDQVISDLKFAESHLPLRSGYSGADMGRATQGAAQAMLARVYLFRKDFQKAEEYALKVINSNQYALEANFINANGVNGNNGKESVFEVGALQYEGTEVGGDQYANTQGVRGTPNRGWGFNRPTPDLTGSFEIGDPRLKGTVINLKDTIDGIVILGDGTTPDVTRDSTGKIIEVQCYNRKVWVPGDNTATQWGHHRRLMRYADVLLMAAEALNENNKPSDALVYLNMVRARARQGQSGILPDIITTSQSDLRDIIFNERRHELAMEGWRFWDLVRTGRAAAALGPLGFISGTHEHLPIPQSEIDISQGSLAQNPGY
ncbi:MAG: RagB/SusD family nutrient uptake outer membrane protein [Bacteroidetes bacterium]|nr:RagB/SusD family nutrient uptake outer membrane protein [Bacteroidota bacterium]